MGRSRRLAGRHGACRWILVLAVLDAACAGKSTVEQAGPGGTAATTVSSGGAVATGGTLASGGVGYAAGTERGPCYGNGTCDPGLTCASGLCVDLSAVGQGGTTAMGGAGTVARAGSLAAGGGASGGIAAGGLGAAGRATGGVAGAAAGSPGMGTAGAGSGGIATGGVSSVAACSGLAYSPSTDGTGQTCTGEAAEAEPSPLDLMVLLDRTQSMTYSLGNADRWSAVRAAMEQFVNDPNSQAIRVGLQFFSRTGNADLTADCNPNAYASPAVEIGPLPQTSTLVLNAMDSVVLGGQTPSAPALQGVIWHAQDWQRTNLKGRRTAVLMITDGLPTQCPVAGQTEASVDDIVAVAASGLSGTDGPSVETYVIGVSMGANSFNLHRVATAGGTRSAYLVTDSTDATSQLVAALWNISNDPLTCEYELPVPNDPSSVLDTTKVRLLHTNASGTTMEVPYAASRGGCSAQTGGWYYDDPTTPSRILLCPCSCAALTDGSVSLEIGCLPPPVPLG